MAVQSPERGERRGVHFQDATPAQEPGAAEPRPRRQWGERDLLVEDEQVEVLVDAETSFEEPTLLVR